MVKNPHIRQRVLNTRLRRQRWIKDFSELFRQGLREEVVLDQLSRRYGVAPSTIWRGIKKQLKKERK